MGWNLFDGTYESFVLSAIAFSTLLAALLVHRSISVSWFCDHTACISLGGRIGTDGGCAECRRVAERFNVKNTHTYIYTYERTRAILQSPNKEFKFVKYQVPGTYIRTAVVYVCFLHVNPLRTAVPF